MEKSIENIWKEGFETNKSFELPLVRNLYTRKSKLIIDKIKSTSKWDNLSLIPISILLFGIFAFLSKIVLGIYVAALIISLFSGVFHCDLLKIKSSGSTWNLNRSRSPVISLIT